MYGEGDKRLCKRTQFVVIAKNFYPSLYRLPSLSYNSKFMCCVEYYSRPIVNVIMEIFIT